MNVDLVCRGFPNDNASPGRSDASFFSFIDGFEFAMSPDDPVCLCFHVTRRKVVNFIRVEKPSRASQLSQCGGAGTGCGWCRDHLTRMLAAAEAGEDIGASLPADAEAYAAGRKQHIRESDP